MQERAALVGGTVAVESSPKQGTTVYARLPVRVDDATAGDAPPSTARDADRGSGAAS